MEDDGGGCARRVAAQLYGPLLKLLDRTRPPRRHLCHATGDVLPHKRVYRRLRNRSIMLPLLGCASSGKSTFMRQVRIIEDGGFLEEERKCYKATICQNIITSLQTLITGMQLHEFQYESRRAEEYSKMIVELEVSDVTELNSSLVAAVKHVWTDSGIQACYKHRDKLYLLDSTKYFMTRLDAVSAADYIPTQQDVLRSRRPTPDFLEYRISIEYNNSTICIVHMGKDWYVQHKWLHCFAESIAFIFISAISEYNQLNECGQNRVSESLAFFKELLTRSKFRRSSAIVFLNKVDIFDEKIKEHHLRHYFPEYQGPIKDPEAAKAFFKDKFEKCCLDASKSVCLCYTCAIDTENMSAVLSTVRDYITRLIMLQLND